MELKRAAAKSNMKGFYNGLKDVWEPKKKASVHLKSTDRMETFSDSKRVVARWSEHTQTLLNVPSDKNHEALDNIPQRITKKNLDEIPTIRRPERWQSTWGRWNSCRSLEAWRRQSVQQTVPTNHQCLGCGFCSTSMEGCQHCDILQERWSKRLWKL